jgi:heme O synthase-like polyprenyltransferase
MVAPGGIDPFAGAVAVLCIAAGAGAPGALNMWYDADIDAVMARTAMRPIPSGRVSRLEALVGSEEEKTAVAVMAENTQGIRSVENRIVVVPLNAVAM